MSSSRSVPARTACSSAFAASSNSPRPKRARPHSRDSEAMPSHAPAHGSVRGEGIGAVGRRAAGAISGGDGTGGRAPRRGRRRGPGKSGGGLFGAPPPPRGQPARGRGGGPQGGGGAG